MAQSIITLSFETYKAQQELNLQPVELDEFVLANVPGLDPNAAIDRNETLPPAEQIVYTADVSQSGFVNPNAIVYSLIMDTGVGDFEFNWVGLRNKESGIVAAILHTPMIQKFKSVLGVQNGNAVTRSIMMAYEGAQNATGITVDASTWQIDFTARLAGMDDRERLANLDLYGSAAFLNEGFKVMQSGVDYLASSGVGYVGGLRCTLDDDLLIANVVKPGGIYLDACWQGLLTSQWQTSFVLTSSAVAVADYVDADGYQHYITKIADIDAAGNITDRRNVEGFAEYERAENAATDADIDAQSTAAKHVKLAQFWRGITNKISAAFSARTINTTSPLNGGGNLSQDRTISVDSATTSQIGVVQLSDSVTSTSSVLAATGKAVKTAYDKAVSAYNLATSKLDATATAINSNKLDNLDSSQFLRSDADDQFTGNLTTGASNHLTFGPNLTWGASLRIGGNGRTVSGADAASIVTTNGNLHLDSGESKNTHINFYAGSEVIFGNGSGVATAKLDNTGQLWKGNGTYKYWHAGNQGAGSGMNADTVDGLEAAQFLRSDVDDSASGLISLTRADEALWATESGTGSSWRGRIGCKNLAGDKAVFLATYNSLGVIGAHNSALSAWADLYINTTDGASGGNVFVPSLTIGSGATITGTAVATTLNATSQVQENGVRVYSPNNPPPASAALGVGQSWQDVKSSRALYATYTNTTGNPIMVAVSWSLTAAVKTMNAYVNELLIASITIESREDGFSFIVPDGSTYRVDAGNTYIQSWTELR